MVYITNVFTEKRTPSPTEVIRSGYLLPIITAMGVEKYLQHLAELSQRPPYPDHETSY